LTKEILHLPTEAASYMVIVPVGVGTLVAALVIERIGKRIDKRKLISLGILLVGVSALLVSFLPDISEFARFDLALILEYLILLKNPFILFLFFLVGFGALSIVVPAQTILQENTDENMRGRIWGVLGMITNIVNFFPVMVIGVLADIFSIKIIIMTLALLVIVWALLNFFFDFRNSNKKKSAV